MLRSIKIAVFALLLASSAAFSQQVITFSGQVLEEGTDRPVPFHPVFVSANDSLLVNTYLTNEDGYFMDSIFSPGTIFNSLYFMTFDCLGLQHDTTVFSLNQTIFIEFSICADSITPGCQADFTYQLDSLSSEPNTFQFYDLSSGNIDTWFWDFGDGHYSYEQNPVHQYAASGQYLVCLTVSNSMNPVQCSDSKCQELASLSYFNFGGLVWLGDYPMNNPEFANDTGIVALYRLNQGLLSFVQSKLFVENGYYWFASIQAGEYVLKAGLTHGSYHYSSYMPTYFGNQVSWDAASVIFLDEDHFEEHIHLAPVVDMPSGIGTISGNIYYDGFTPAGSGQLITIILADEDNNPLRFAEPDNTGKFVFSSLPFSTYLVKADLAGHSSVTAVVALNSYSIHSSVDLTISGSAFYGMEEFTTGPVSAGNPYPNPAADRLNIDINTERQCSCDLTIYDMMGKRCLERNIDLPQGEKTIQLDIALLPKGIYMIRIEASGQSLPLSRKFVK